MITNSDRRRAVNALLKNFSRINLGWEVRGKWQFIPAAQAGLPDSEFIAFYNSKAQKHIIALLTEQHSGEKHLTTFTLSGFAHLEDLCKQEGIRQNDN